MHYLDIRSVLLTTLKKRYIILSIERLAQHHLSSISTAEPPSIQFGKTSPNPSTIN